jgi:sugar phosphate isomerase/epimerase
MTSYCNFTVSLCIIMVLLGATAHANLGQAWGPEPVGLGVPADVNVLHWNPGNRTAKTLGHDVYFGIDANAVATATSEGPLWVYRGRQSVTQWSPGELMLGQHYFWRVDQIEAQGGRGRGDRITPGPLWSFTVDHTRMIDDFNDYTDTKSVLQVWEERGSAYTWMSANVSATGNALGVDLRPEGETGGAVTRHQDINFTQYGARALAFEFSSGPNRQFIENIYVELSDGTNNARVVIDDPNLLGHQDWGLIDADLNRFSEVRLSHVKSLTLGVTVPTTLATPITVYFDQLRLLPQRCVEGRCLATDLNGDCVVDELDLTILTEHGLEQPALTMADINTDGIVDQWDHDLLEADLGRIGLWPHDYNEPRSLYTYSFGGLEGLEVGDAVELLDYFGYMGVAVEARGAGALKRLSEFYEWSERKGDGFEVVSAYMAHRFGQYGFSDAGHRAAIDLLAGKGGTLWVWVRDDLQDGSVTDTKVEQFIEGIVEYAVSKDVKIILYPHYNTYYPSVEDVLPLVKEINHPSCGIAINLCHELMSDKGDVLENSFEIARDHIAAIIISGAQIELDRSSVASMNASTIKSLENSEYDLRPYMRLIKQSGFEGPIGFINFRLSKQADYLERTMNRWEQLCRAVGLYEVTNAGEQGH